MDIHLPPPPPPFPATNVPSWQSYTPQDLVAKDLLEDVAPGDSVNSTCDDVNIGLIEDANLDSEDIDTEDDVEEDDNATTSFMAMKSSKGTISSKTKGGTWTKSLYECWKDDYDDNRYDDDEEGEDLTEQQLAFRDVYDISLRGQIKH
ncbi:hypothetical protein Tco_0511432 [Tanacetum coccineum]